VQFSASYDRTTKIISTVVCLGLLAIVFAVRNPILAVLALLILAVSIAWSPRGYRIEGRMLLVHRLAGTVRIALAGIREARRTTPEDLRGCIKLMGSGGLFGYYGLFSTSKLGKSTWYMTNRTKSVVLISDAKTVLLSPDDPESFLAAIQAAAPVPISTNGSSLAAGRSWRGKLVAPLSVALVLAAVGLGVAASAYSPGPPSFTLTSDALTIHDRFYPVTLQSRDVDLGGIRIVDLSQSTDWRPVQRTNGFANSHYQSGWFRTASGTKVRLYRAGNSVVVLLPPSGAGAPVLYQAEDPEDFVHQLRIAWGASGQAKAGQ
jgi:hypothetical protein